MPRTERQNELERQAFFERLRLSTADLTAKLWFSDEGNVEGDQRLRRRWVQLGKRRTVPDPGDHIRQNIMVTGCPQRGQLFSLVADV